MPINRWFFCSPRSEETFIYEGNPESLPTFKGWVTTKTKAGAKKVQLATGKFIYREPSVMHKGILYFGRLLSAGLSGGPCSPNCRKAIRPFCRCSCHGKNHGIENRDMANAVQEEDVIYLG